MSRVSSLLNRYYYSRPDFTDGTTEFHALLSRHIRPQSTILEIGAGPANRTTSHLARLGEVIGVDVSHEVLHNTALARAFVYDGRQLPFNDNTFDACVSDFVLEHIEHASDHFKEVSRVLKPGGAYCFRTPNVWHYVTFMSSILPHSAHRALANRMRGLADGAHEPYPTVYAANSRASLTKLCQISGLDVVGLHMVEKEPSYGHLSAAVFYPMMCYERLVNASDLLAGMRINIFGVVQKPARVAPAHLVSAASEAS